MNTNPKNEIAERVKPYLSAKDEESAVNRLFCFDQCFAFKDTDDKGFQLIQDVASYFDIPIRGVHIVGSAQLGYSFQKEKAFVPGEFDLDIAIVNTELFLEYYELCYMITNQYRNRMDFPKVDGLEPAEVANRFQQYLAKGYLRPDYMPLCEKRRQWMTFFDKLGNDYIDRFKRITCGIYLSQNFFSIKQKDVLTKIGRLIK